MINDSASTFADSRMDEIISTIKDRDADTLELMFSAQALNESNAVDDFHKKAEYIFNFIEGEIKSWEKSGGPVESSSLNYGRVINEYNVWYKIDTDLSEYIILFDEVTKDTGNAENVGLHMLKIIRSEDREILFENLTGGIFMPE